MQQRRVTLADVARLAGVAPATASRALTGHGQASAAAVERVRQAAAELGFTPNQAARALASQRTHAIALVIPEPVSMVLGDPYLVESITGVSEAFRGTDYQMLLVIVRPDEPPAKALRVIRQGMVDGAIVVSHHGAVLGGQGPAAPPGTLHGVPAVYIGQPWGDPQCMFVTVDDLSAGRLATSRLIERGATRVACVAGSADMVAVQGRTQGWRETLVAAGLTPGPVEYEPFTMAGGAQAMERILAAYPQVDGVFAQSDMMALGAIGVLTKAGRKVPDDVLVASVDNSAVAVAAAPPLTSVTNPAAALAAQAARMLLRVLDQDQAPTDQAPEIQQPTLVVRESA
ncbi:MAG: LacI family transcriptional regulator [Bifidobacteriaceae bacterium]|jgi:DNA-binding LacI/PurR family transcriptional regulator|nr:LacI family transcriptional regulator [Bifidobacteriaceae bacterium]